MRAASAQACGARPESSGTRFRVWAPFAERLAVHVAGRELPMEAGGDGHFAAFVPGEGAGSRYGFRIDGGDPLPDPCSRFQPDGVHGLSEVVDTDAFRWKHGHGPRLASTELIVYELHIGTLTEAGTYAAAAEKLSEIRALGANAVELMPVAQAAGRWNWGYDGANLFAPNHAYGRPQDLARFVDAAHGAGLAVLLDVVYNHLGPEGNYLDRFGPYHRSDVATPWGGALNFDGTNSRPVREYFRANTLQWIRDYRFDGLRLDAIAAIHDNGPVPIVAEIASDLHRHGRENGRRVHVIGESNVYDEGWLGGGDSGLDAIWSDDLPHALLSTLTGEREFGGRSYRGAPDLADALRRGFLYRRDPSGGTVQAGSDGRARLERMVCGLQNHDWIGNHPEGLRVHRKASHAAQAASAALILLYPSIPLVFMGEEYAAESPFLFFSDFGDEPLRRAVEEGRRREFPMHDWAGAIRPTDDAAFEQSRLAPPSPAGERMRAWYRDLLEIRRDWKARGVLDPETLRVSADPDTRLFALEYHAGGLAAGVAVNLSADCEQEHAFEHWSGTGPRLASDGVRTTDAAGSFRLPPRSAVVVG